MTHLYAEPTVWQWTWLIIAAFLAGVLNAVAGGGSFLSFPALLGMNMLPVQANATNTVAIWPGQLTSVAAYWPDVRRNRSAAILMGLAGLIGGTAGATALPRRRERDNARVIQRFTGWPRAGSPSAVSASRPR